VTPGPPSPFPAFNKRKLAGGTLLVRVHDPRFNGAGFNPCLGGDTRFAPLSTAGGSCLPTLYAASTLECAVHESIFHDLAYDAPDKFIRLDKVISRSISWLELTTEVVLAGLHEPDLNKLNLTRAQLIDTPRSQYPQTARWAEAFYLADAEVAELVWTSRRCDPERAFIFFEDRLPAGSLVVKHSIEISRSAQHLAEIRDFGRRAGITITM
jgi:hypothetical protein